MFDGMLTILWHRLTYGVLWGGKAANEDEWILINFEELEKYLNVNDPSIKQIKEKMNENSKLYKYRSSPRSWVVLCGREAIILKNDDEVVYQKIISMN